MARKKLKLIGKRCGMLEIISRTNKANVVLVRCDCGVEKKMYLTNFKVGNTISCGCARRKSAKDRHTTHGLTNHPLFFVWQSMIQRCYNKNLKSFNRYGAREIIVCDEWVSDFKVFYEWAIDKWEQGLQIDRIDNNGNYSPSNCRFVLRKVNQNNRNCTVFCSHNGITKSLSEWCEDLGIKLESARSGLRRGKDISYYVNKYS